MKQTQIEFIKEKCIEANPSIKDLVMGCRVKTGMVPSSEDTIVKYDDSDESILTAKEWEFYLKDVEILGRDIQLADVLLAIPEKFDNQKSFLIFYHLGNGATKLPDYRWNLLLPLHLQSDETIEFLYNLLSNRE